MYRTVVLLALLVGCSRPVASPEPNEQVAQGRSAEGAAVPAQALNAPAPVSPRASVPTSGALVSAVHKGLWMGKPPLGVHTFDVTVRNPSAEPRWILIPETFPYAGQATPAPGEGALAELQVFELSKAPRVIIANGVGSHFWALKLAGSATLTLTDLKIESWWDRIPKQTALEVLVATDITIDGAPMESLFGADPTSESATVTAPKDAGDDRALDFWHPADRTRSSEVSLQLESRSRSTEILNAP